MSLMLSAIKTLWDNFYYTCIGNIDFKQRSIIGYVLLILFLFSFLKAAKGKKKGQLINNWFWFWISMISLIVAVLYLS